MESDLNKVLANEYENNLRKLPGFHQSAFQPIKPIRQIDIKTVKNAYSIENPLTQNMMMYMNQQPHFPSASQVPPLNTISRMTQISAPTQEPKKDPVKIVKLESRPHPEVISDHNKRNPPK
jgi:predicted alpha/beta-fold hydrolase